MHKWTAGVGVLAVLAIGYYLIMFLGLKVILHVNGSVDDCGRMTVQALEMQRQNPRDFAAEKVLQSQVDAQCNKALNETKVLQGVIAH